jgi:hypothetical protein
MRRLLAVMVLAVATLAVLPGATAATLTAADKRKNFDLSQGFVELTWAHAQRIGMNRKSFESLTAPAGVETILGSAGCSQMHIVKRAASGDVRGQACALHSTTTDGWAGWWRVECYKYNTSTLQTCNFAIKYPYLISDSNALHIHWFPEENVTGVKVWQDRTAYNCTGFANGERVFFTSSVNDRNGDANGYRWAVRFSNGKYANGWYNNGTLFTLGSSCNVG